MQILNLLQDFLGRYIDVVVQYFLDYPAAIGLSFSRRGSGNPERPVKHNYALRRHTQENKLR